MMISLAFWTRSHGRIWQSIGYLKIGNEFLSLFSRMQYGHHETVRDPYMAQYLLGTRCGVDIIDVDKVIEYVKYLEF